MRSGNFKSCLIVYNELKLSSAKNRLLWNILCKPFKLSSKNTYNLLKKKRGRIKPYQQIKKTAQNTHTYMHTQVCVFVYTYIYMLIHVYICTYICIYGYIIYAICREKVKYINKIGKVIKVSNEKKMQRLKKKF